MWRRTFMLSWLFLTPLTSNMSRWRALSRSTFQTCLARRSPSSFPFSKTTMVKSSTIALKCLYCAAGIFEEEFIEERRAGLEVISDVLGVKTICNDFVVFARFMIVCWSLRIHIVFPCEIVMYPNMLFIFIIYNITLGQTKLTDKGKVSFSDRWVFIS